MLVMFLLLLLGSRGCYITGGSGSTILAASFVDPVYHELW